MAKYENIGIETPKILLPKKGTDLKKWAVVACDQYTSQPEYWKQVEELVGADPSTLHIMLPELYLEEPDVNERIEKVNSTMKKYLSEDTFETCEGFVYLQRKLRNGQIRNGLMIALDLEHYDYNKGSTSLIRATEGTILSRIPPRVKIREGAQIELPHIMVLIDDPKKTVIEPLAENTSDMETVYDFDLMIDSGHLAGYKVDAENEKKIAEALEKLADPAVFKEKYNLDEEKPVLLFAMGDGNHSLATAKTLWENIKKDVGMNHPARYALVELVNLHDESLDFEAIHRVVFGLKKDLMESMKEFYGEAFSYEKCSDAKEMVTKTDSTGEGQRFGFIQNGEYCLVTINKKMHTLTVGTLQMFLDKFMETGAESIDYVHGEDVVCELGSKEGNAGFYLPTMAKDELFKTVIIEGATPRKTFSMGEAHDKRFYMECRKIVQ